MSKLRRQASEAAAFIRKHWPHQPHSVIVLGTGYGSVAERVRKPVILNYAKIPHFPRSTALAHVGRLVCGELFGRPVAVMQGRCHRYEGYSLDQVALPTIALGMLGPDRLVLTNAAGGLNPYFALGDLMLIESHINLMGGEPASTRDARRREPAIARPSVAQPYCPRLLDQVWRTSRTADFEARRGVYLAVTGPTYETRAEYRCFRRLGGDAVGMSTVPEAIGAAAQGVPVLAMSVITNVAKPDAPDEVDAEDVVAASQAAAPHVLRVIEAALQ